MVFSVCACACACMRAIMTGFTVRGAKMSREIYCTEGAGERGTGGGKERHSSPSRARAIERGEVRLTRRGLSKFTGARD